MTVLEGDEPARLDRDLLSGRRLPHNVAIERPRLHVQSPVKTPNIGVGKPERFIIHIQFDDLGIRHIDDGLPRRRETIGVLRIHDGPASRKSR